VGTGGESLAEQKKGRATVEVIGVGDAERFGQVQIILSGEHRVYGAAQATLDREADLAFLRPARGDVLFDLLSGFGIDDDDDVFKTRGPRV